MSENEPVGKNDVPADASALAAPQPRIEKMFWPFPIIWIVPLLAAVLAGYYVYLHHQENGVEIIINFDDGGGLKPGETVISLHGVPLGRVKTVELSDDHGHAIAHVRLASSAEYLARADSLFWVVKPELSLQNISGLNTLVSGAYIDCRPGDGPVCHEFNGLGGPPVLAGDGLHIIASADSIGALTVDSPVTYRGIQVGIVKDIRLSTLADSANITLFIWDRYRTLVRTNSEFWMLKGADISGSLFSGLKVRLGSVQNLLTGGVAFATPERDFGPMAREGSSFVLHDRAEDDWLKWRARILLPPLPTDAGEKKSAEADKAALPALKHE
jgi:paraquat-inducible protein B